MNAPFKPGNHVAITKRAPTSGRISAVDANSNLRYRGRILPRLRAYKLCHRTIRPVGKLVHGHRKDRLR